MNGRVIYAGLHLLDRQLRDREQRLCGKVDDLELTQDEDGTIRVEAILTGPGHLLYRLGRRRSGAWFARQAARVTPSPFDEPGRIPYQRIASLGVTVDLAVDASEISTAGTERWVRDHVIGHLPGSGSDADE